MQYMSFFHHKSSKFLLDTSVTCHVIYDIFLSHQKRKFFAANHFVRRSVASLMLCSFLVTTPGVTGVMESICDELGVGRGDPQAFATAKGITKADLVTLIAGGNEFFITQETARKILRQNPYGGLERGSGELLETQILECCRLDTSTQTFGDRFAARELERHLWGQNPEESEFWILRHVQVQYPHCMYGEEKKLLQLRRAFAEGTINQDAIRHFGQNNPDVFLQYQNKYLEYGVEVRLIPRMSQPIQKEILEELGIVDSESLGRVFLTSLLVHPMNARFSEFRCIADGHKRLITSGLAFDGVNPASMTRAGEKHKVFHNDLYGLSDVILGRPIDQNVRQHLLDITPEILVANWLMALEEFNQVALGKDFECYLSQCYRHLETLSSEELLEERVRNLLPEEQQHFRAHLPGAGLPIHVHRGTVPTLLKIFNCLKSFLKLYPQATYQQLFEHFDPFAFHVHRAGSSSLFIEDEGSIGARPFPGFLDKTFAEIAKQSDFSERVWGLIPVAEAFQMLLEPSLGELGNPGSGFQISLLNQIAVGLRMGDEEGFRVQVAPVIVEKMRQLLWQPEVAPRCIFFAKMLGVDLDCPYPEQHGWTLLHKAVQEMKRDFVDALLNCGVQTESLWKDPEGVKHTALDLLINQRGADSAPQIFATLLRKGAGSQLMKPEAALEWYRENLRAPASDQREQLTSAFRNLARNNQKFAWLAVLEDVFPQAFVSEEEMRRYLAKQILKNAADQEEYDLFKNMADGSTTSQDQRKRLRNYTDNILKTKVHRELVQKLNTVEKAITYLDLCEAADDTNTIRQQLDTRLNKLGYSSTADPVCTYLGIPPGSVSSVQEALTRVFLKDYLVKTEYMTEQEPGSDEALLRGVANVLLARTQSLPDAYSALVHLNSLRLSDPGEQIEEACELIEGADSGTRFLLGRVQNQLWNGEHRFKRTNRDGRRAVGRAFKEDGLLGRAGVLFIKRFPEIPGYEAAARLVMHGLGVHGVPFSDLLRIRGIPYLVSQGIPDGTGQWKTLRESHFDGLPQDREAVETAIRERAQELFKRLDPVSTIELILMAMVLNPEDGKLDNAVLTNGATPDQLRLVLIDNDHIFAPAIGDPTLQAQLRESRLTQVETFLFALGKERFGVEGPMDRSIPDSVIEKFKTVNPQEFVVKWLTQLAKLGERYAALFPTVEQGGSGSRDKSTIPYFWERQESCVRIPVNDRVVSVVYDNLSQIKEILTSDSTIKTPMDLLSALSPVLKNREKLGFLGIHPSSATAVARSLGFRTTRETIQASIAPGSGVLHNLSTRMERTCAQLALVEDSIKKLKRARKKNDPRDIQTSLADHTRISQQVFGFLTNADTDVVRSDYQLCRFLRNTDMEGWSSPEQARLIQILKGLGQGGIARYPLTRLTFSNCHELKCRDFNGSGEQIFSPATLFHLSIPGCPAIQDILQAEMIFDGLNRLDISRAESLDHDLILKGDRFPNLSSLVLKKVPELKTLTLENFRNLTLLSLSGCQNLQSFSLREASPGSSSTQVSSNLQEIRLAEVMSWDDDKQDALIAWTPKLSRMRLAGTKVTFSGFRERFPRVPSEIFQRLTQNLNISDLFEAETFSLSGMQTQSNWNNLENGTHLGTSVGLGVLSFFAPWVGIPLSIAWGVGVAFKKRSDRSALKHSIERSSFANDTTILNEGGGSAAVAATATATGRGVTTSIGKAVAGGAGSTIARIVGSSLSGGLGAGVAAFDIFLDENARDKIVRLFIGSVLSEGIKRNHRLRELELRDVSLGDEGFLPIIEALNGRTLLTALSLANCDIGDKGVNQLSAVLNSNQTLLSLNLSHNRITNNGVQALRDGLEGNRTLYKLDMQENPNISPEANRVIQSLMARNALGRQEVTETNLLRGAFEGRQVAFSRSMLQEDSPLFGYNGLGIERMTVVRLLLDALGKERRDVISEITREAQWALQNKKTPKGLPEWCSLLVGVDMAADTGSFTRLLAEYVKSAVLHEPWLQCAVEIPESQGILNAIAKITNQEFFIWGVGEDLELQMLKRLNPSSDSVRSVDKAIHILKNKRDSLQRAERLVLSESLSNPLSPSALVYEPHRLERPPHCYGLALDGGGMRGLIPARMLVHLKDMIGRGRSVFELFDGISGTSVGGILALGLTIPGENGQPVLDPETCIDLFKRDGQHIFGTQPIGPLSGFLPWTPKYSVASLESILKTKLGETTVFGRALKPVWITTVRVDSPPHKPCIFSSAVPRHKDWPAWKVARTTSAAPKFFGPPTFSWPTDALGTSRPDYTFWDGGVWMNNPSEILLDGMRKLYNNIIDHDVTILSFGTGDAQAAYLPPYPGLSRSLGFGLIFGSMDLCAQSVDDRIVERLQGRYVRLQPVLERDGCMIEAELDDFNPGILELYEAAADKKFEEQKERVEGVVRRALGT